MARSLRVSTRSGRVEVHAEDRDGIFVERGAREVESDPLDPTGEPLTITSGSDRVVVRVPRGTDLVVGSMSGRVELHGALGTVAVSTRSGSIAVESADRVSVRTRSGRVEIGECHGTAQITTMSGRVDVHRTGGVQVATTTGRVEVHEARGAVKVRSVAGRISITVTTSPVDARLESFSGRIRVAVPAGARPAQRFSSRSGSIRSSVEHGGDGRIWARTLSGSIQVTDG